MCFRDYNGDPCKRFLLKLCYILPNLHRGQDMYMEDVHKVAVSVDAFNQEVQDQIDIFRCTNANLQPITPLIYHSQIYRNSHEIQNNIFKRELIHDERTRTLVRNNLINIMREYPNIRIGVIFMEMRDGYTTISEWKTEGNNEHVMQQLDFLAMTGEVLNRLHKKCGIVHGDLHESNILIQRLPSGPSCAR